MLQKMGIIENPTCLYWNNIETIEHIHIGCDNVRHLCRNTENWVRLQYNPHYKMSVTKRILGIKCQSDQTHDTHQCQRCYLSKKKTFIFV